MSSEKIINELRHDSRVIFGPWFEPERNSDVHSVFTLAVGSFDSRRFKGVMTMPLALLATGMIVSGCGSVSSTVRGSSLAAPARLAARSVTGVGNRFDVKIRSWGAPALEISYDDARDYFWSGQQSPLFIEAYVRVSMHDGSRVEVPNMRLAQPTGGSTVYGGTVELGTTSTPSEFGGLLVDIKAVELAFHSNGKWDSDGGKNYQIKPRR
jgi:hypothetical protein